MLSQNVIPFKAVTTENYQYNKIAGAIDFLYEHFREQPTLEETAAQVNMSAFHFQRTFTEWAGISPKRFLQYLTTDYLKGHILEFPNLMDAADDAGLSSQSRVYDLFVNLEAVTPQEYKEKGRGLEIEYGFHPTPFGEIILGATERGVSHLSFLKDTNRKEAIEALESNWENASIRPSTGHTEELANAIFNRSKNAKQEKLNVLVKGTNFQVKVWNALLEIPYGSVTTYQSIAQKIGEPKAMQAVGSAVGANNIAYLIPCHRVIRKNLVIADYRWGSERKKAMLGWELSKSSVA